MEDPVAVTMLLPFVLQVHATNVGWRYEQFFVQVDTEYGERHAHVSAPYHLLGPTWECDEVSIVEWGCAELHWEWVEQKLRLHVMDPEAHTSRVVVIRHAENAWKSSRANPPTPFKVQNTCGAWVFPMYMNTKSALNVLIATSAMKRLQRERAPHEYKKNGPARRRRRNMLYNCIQQDSLHALSGTFVVADETLKVPFRGVRSYEGMLQDWLLLLGNHNRKRMLEEGIACSIYMVILKGNLGFMLNLDPVFNYVKLRLALLGGCSRNLSMVRLGETEVCEVYLFLSMDIWARRSNRFFCIGGGAARD
jgi:hypothetical protein